MDSGKHRTITSNFKEGITARNVDGNVGARRFRKRGILGALMGAIGVTVAVKSRQGAALNLAGGQGEIDLNDSMERLGRQLYKSYTKRQALNKLKYQVVD